MKYLNISLNLILVFTILACGLPQVKLEETKEEVKPVEKRIPPLRANIAEIEEENGKQKYIYFRLGSDNKIGRYRTGLIGKIYNDSSARELVGKFRVTKIYPNISKGTIIDLRYTIDQKGIVLIEIDHRYLTTIGE